MDGWAKLPRDAQVVLGGALVYVIFSFFNWQRFPFGDIAVVYPEWRGIGILAGLLGFALLMWELSRALDAQFTLRVNKPMTSLVLALLVALFTLITFLTHGDGRNWPAWVGLAVSLVIAAAAWARGRREGVQLPARSA